MLTERTSELGRYVHGQTPSATPAPKTFSDVGDVWGQNLSEMETRKLSETEMLSETCSLFDVEEWSERQKLIRSGGKRK